MSAKRGPARTVSVSDVLAEPAVPEPAKSAELEPAEPVSEAPARPKLSAITHSDLLMNGRAVDINTGGVWTRDPGTGEVSYEPPRSAR